MSFDFPLIFFHCQGAETQHSIPVQILYKSRMLKLVLLLAQISSQRNYLVPTWSHLQPCKMLSLCIHLSHTPYPLVDVGNITDTVLGFNFLRKLLHYMLFCLKVIVLISFDRGTLPSTTRCT